MTPENINFIMRLTAIYTIHELIRVLQQTAPGKTITARAILNKEQMILEAL